MSTGRYYRTLKCNICHLANDTRYIKMINIEQDFDDKRKIILLKESTIESDSGETAQIIKDIMNPLNSLKYLLE